MWASIYILYLWVINMFWEKIYRSFPICIMQNNDRISSYDEISSLLVHIMNSATIGWTRYARDYLCNTETYR